MGDDAWEIFAKLCQTVCENENVYLEVIVSHGLIEFMLMPLEEEEDDEWI